MNVTKRAESMPEVGVGDGVDDGIEETVDVAQPANDTEQEGRVDAAADS